MGMGKGSAKIVVGQVDGPEESMARHDRVEKKVNAGERSDVSSGGAGRLKAVTAGGATNATVHAGGGAAERSWNKEGGERPLLLGDGVKIGGGGEGEMDGRRR